jgi:hypothetical protein
MRTTLFGGKDPGYERQQRSGRGTPIRGVGRGNVIRLDQGDQNLAGGLHGVFRGVRRVCRAGDVRHVAG